MAEKQETQSGQTATQSSDSYSSCQHTEIMRVSGKVDDIAAVELESEGKAVWNKEGYLPYIKGISDDADYITLKICLSCGIIIRLPKMTAKEWASEFEQQKKEQDDE